MEHRILAQLDSLRNVLLGTCDNTKMVDNELVTRGRQTMPNSTISSLFFLSAL